MPSPNDRFKVTISLDIEKLQEDGSYSAFARTIQEYENMNYEFMQQTQGTVVRALVDALVPIGDEAAAEIAAARGNSPKK